MRVALAVTLKSINNARPCVRGPGRSDATRDRRSLVQRENANVGELAEPFETGLPTLLKHIRVLERGGSV